LDKFLLNANADSALNWYVLFSVSVSYNGNQCCYYKTGYPWQVCNLMFWLGFLLRITLSVCLTENKSAPDTWWVQMYKFIKQRIHMKIQYVY